MGVFSLDFSPFILFFSVNAVKIFFFGKIRDAEICLLIKYGNVLTREAKKCQSLCHQQGTSASGFLSNSFLYWGDLTYSARQRWRGAVCILSRQHLAIIVTVSLKWGIYLLSDFLLCASFFSFCFSSSLYSLICGCGGLRCWVLGGLFSCDGGRGLLSGGSALASRCSGFSRCRGQALEHGLRSCGPRAYLLRGMWDLPRSGIKPVSPELAGRFSTTKLPGKPCFSPFSL